MEAMGTLFTQTNLIISLSPNYNLKDGETHNLFDWVHSKRKENQDKKMTELC